MDLNIKSKKPIIICTDFNRDLKLFNLPNKVRSRILKNNKIKIINFSFNNPKCKEALIYWGDLIDDNRIKFLKKLKWIHLGCVGHDKIKNLELLRFIKLTNSSGIMSNAVTESVFNFVFIFLRRFDQCIYLRKDKKLNRKNFDLYFNQIRNIKNCKFLIFGGGDISKNFILKLKHFSKNISLISSRPSILKNIKNYQFKNFKPKKIDFDFVISVLPNKKKYDDYFDSNFFKKMRKDSFFINVGRGSVVKEKDLIKSLSKKQIAGAALDVFKDEPIKHTNQFFNYKNCLITPHISGLFNNYWEEEEKLFLLNLKKFFLEKRLKNLINFSNGK